MASNLFSKFPTDKEEEVDKRSLYSKTFILESQKRKLICVPGLVHYVSGSSLNDINTDFQQSGNLYYVSETPYSLSFDVSAGVIEFLYTSRAAGQVRFSLIEVNDLSFIPNFNISVSEEFLTFTDLTSGFDLIIQARPGGIELWKIIKKPDAPHIFTWRFEVDQARDFKVNMKTHARDNLNEEPLTGKRLNDKWTRRQVEVLTSNIPSVVLNKEVFIYREEITGRTAVRRDPVSRRQEWEDGVVIYPIEVDADITENIVADTDDGNSWSPSSWSSRGSYHNFGRGVYHSGYRYQGIALDQGVTIDLAVLKLNKSHARDGTPTGYLYGDYVSSAGAWTWSDNPLDITKTTAKAAFDVTAGTGAFNVTCTSIIQEIVNHPSWSSGNNLRLGAISLATPDGEGYIDDYPSGTPAYLEIDYSVGGGAHVGSLVNAPRLRSKIGGGLV